MISSHSASNKASLLKPSSHFAQAPSSSLSFDLRSSRSQNLGTLNGGSDRRRAGSVGRNDSDFYKFKITRQRRVSLNVTNTELISNRYIRGSLLDNRQRSLRTTDKARAPFGREDISLRLNSGTYFVKISTDGRRIFYSFRLSID